MDKDSSSPTFVGTKVGRVGTTEKERILVVEDNPANMLLFCDLLQADGYQVLQAGSGPEALELAREGAPDLVLLDIQLPGMDGFAVLRELKTHPLTQEVPVVALTSYAMLRDKQGALAAGFSAHITKPIDTKTFRLSIRGLLEEKAAALKSAG